MITPDRFHSPLQDAYAQRLTARLSGGLDELPHDISERLRAARVRAVTQRKVVSVQPALGRAMAGAAVGVVGAGAGGQSDDNLGFLGRLASALPIIALVAGLVGIHGIQADRRAVEIAEVDAAILTDDLPPSAYVDPGFAQFLKSEGH